jgi:hypothetical protein
MIDVIESSKLMFVATVRADGTPNLSPKGAALVLNGEHSIFVDIASPQTVDNLRARPSIELNAVDFPRRRGFGLQGTAEILEPGDRDFDWIAGWLFESNGHWVPCHHGIKIKVSEAAEVLSPAYTHQNMPEPELRRAWVAKYGLDEA